MKDTILISGTSNPQLARAVARGLRIPMVDVAVGQFQDGETYVNIGGGKVDAAVVHNKHVLLVQSGAPHANATFMELLLLVDAVKRLHAKKITVILPFYPYRRQERKWKAGESVSAAVIAQCLSATGVDAVAHVELHVEKIREFFSIPCVHVRTESLFVEYFGQLLAQRRRRKNKRFVWQGDPWVVVAADLGSRAPARTIADRLNLAFEQSYKHRHDHDVVEIDSIHRSIEGKNVIIVDDEIDTGKTMVENAQVLQQFGARKIYVASTHAVFASGALKRLLAIRSLEKIVVTDTIAHPEFAREKKVHVLSVAPLLIHSLKKK